MARATKRQLKEDKLISTTAKLSIFLNQRWKEIAGVIVSIVLIVGTLLLYYKYTMDRNERAARLLGEAMTLFAEAEFALETDGKIGSTTEKYEKAKTEFQEVSQKSGHGYTISKAMFYSAKCSYQLGKYDEAISLFQGVIDKYSKSIFALYAQKGVGQSYEQLGSDEDLRKAIQQYDELSRYPETYVTLRALVDRGRCYEKLGEWEQAVVAYKTIVDRFKRNVDSAIQAKSKTLVQKARDVLSKYEIALGKDQSDSGFVKSIDEAKVYETQEQWFEALKMYDRTIFSQKEGWSEEKLYGESARVLQDASDTLKEYQDLSTNVIKDISSGRKYEKQEDWDNALRYYRRAARFDFLPGMDLFEEAQFRIDWINSIEKPRIAAGDQQEQADS
jgi:tetratricopeptide (TPR) repeat protein